MNKGLLKRIVFYDFAIGIKKRYLYFGAAVIIFAVELGYFLSQCNAMRAGATITSKPGLGDCLLFVFCGIEKYNSESASSFNIPSLWLLLNLFIMYLVGYYPVQSLKKSSLQALLRCKSRIEFWTSKIIWCFFTVAIFYILLILVALCFVLFAGDFSVPLHTDICENVLEIKIANINVLGFLAPFLIIFMTAAIQVNLSIILSPVLSNLIMVIYMVCSVYYSGKFLVYNFCMYKRNFETDASADIITALILSLILFIISSFLALKKSSKIDIC